MIFQRIYKPDNETLKAFIPYRKNFVYSPKSAYKQLDRIIKTSVSFYKVFDDKKFIGCLFVDLVDDETKTIEFGGFAVRHANTKKAIEQLMAFLNFHYPDYQIKAITVQLAAKFSLIKAGLKNIKGDYFYEREKNSA